MWMYDTLIKRSLTKSQKRSLTKSQKCMILLPICLYPLIVIDDITLLGHL